MLYQPTFCCHCGDKIERIKWRLWTSRRFCENCETEFRKEDWLPKIFTGIILTGGLFFFGSYLKAPEKNVSLITNKVSGNSFDKFQNKVSLENVNSNNAGTERQVPPGNVNQNVAFPVVKVVRAQDTQNEKEIPVYFCGAQTKKGTACVRKVKGGGRCWQHTGQVSMLPKDKLAAQ